MIIPTLAQFKSSVLQSLRSKTVTHTWDSHDTVFTATSICESTFVMYECKKDLSIVSMLYSPRMIMQPAIISFLVCPCLTSVPLRISLHYYKQVMETLGDVEKSLKQQLYESCKTAIGMSLRRGARSFRTGPYLLAPQQVMKKNETSIFAYETS